MVSFREKNARMNITYTHMPMTNLFIDEPNVVDSRSNAYFIDDILLSIFTFICNVNRQRRDAAIFDRIYGQSLEFFCLYIVILWQISDQLGFKWCPRDTYDGNDHQ